MIESFFSTFAASDREEDFTREDSMALNERVKTVSSLLLDRVGMHDVTVTTVNTVDAYCMKL